MDKKLPIFLTTALVAFIFFLKVPHVSAYHLRFSLQQLILKEIEQMYHPVYSQIGQVSITQSVVTPAPTLTPTPTPGNTSKNTNLNNSQQTTSTTSPLSTSSDVRNYMMNEINKYRSSQGLSSVQTSDETCNFAQIRAKEIASRFSHDEFTQRVNSHTLPYTKWTKVTENIAETPNYKDVVNLWINSPGHAANMRADTPYVCVAEYQDFYAYEGVRP